MDSLEEGGAANADEQAWKIISSIQLSSSHPLRYQYHISIASFMSLFLFLVFLVKLAHEFQADGIIQWILKFSFVETQNDQVPENRIEYDSGSLHDQKRNYLSAATPEFDALENTQPSSIPPGHSFKDVS